MRAGMMRADGTASRVFVGEATAADLADALADAR